jgi:hypothetical protein
MINIHHHSPFPYISWSNKNLQCTKYLKIYALNTFKKCTKYAKKIYYDIYVKKMYNTNMLSWIFIAQWNNSPQIRIIKHRDIYIYIYIPDIAS